MNHFEHLIGALLIALALPLPLISTAAEAPAEAATLANVRTGSTGKRPAPPSPA